MEEISGAISSPFEKREYVKGERGGNLLRWILTEPAFEDEPFPLFSCETFKGLFLKKDQALFDEMRAHLQQLSKHVCARLQAAKEASEGRILEIMLVHVLALFPFLEPEEESEIVFPQKVKGEWRLVTYRTEYLPLSPRWLGSPLLALALVPVDPDPLHFTKLVFMGTPPPTVSGALLSYWTDFVPGFSIGEAAFSLFAKKRVREWLKGQNKRVEVSGISLGGALALLTGSHFPEHVNKIDAYVPGAMSKKAVRRYERELQFLASPPEVSIFSQEGDVVSKIGKGWAEGWQRLHLVAAKTFPPLSAHVRAFSGRPVTVVQGGREETLSALLTLLYHIISIPVFLLLTPLLILKGILGLVRCIFFKKYVNR